MKAMVLEKIGQRLKHRQLNKPKPNSSQVLIKVASCGICRTDLHVVDGDLKHPKLPLIPGHQIVGVVQEKGESVKGITIGQRIGVPWLGGSCGVCSFCLAGRENLCDKAIFTGYQLDGGFAEYCVADYRFCFPIPNDYLDEQAAPLFCAGLIGYRALLKAGNAEYLGIYGFGAAAHILIQVAHQQGRKCYAFTKAGDIQAQQFAYQLGAVWAGDSTQIPPQLLDAAIIFAPIGELIPIALSHTIKGGIVICAGIHMSPIPSFPYDLLWGERIICSVANLTRKDGEEFLALAPKIPIETDIHIYPLLKVNQALDDLRYGRLIGAAVIKIE
ncbi:zinc-dependent alcohol dehydrogenase family protein [Legionella sp. CNM-1927-20]|uniref:zinc-dependent alcohol dehydrogenase family protein n=1 Tax=Legionella sp. CNM-1927-20 TaxID=3422221 RepID=UPI00403ACE74